VSFLVLVSYTALSWPEALLFVPWTLLSSALKVNLSAKAADPETAKMTAVKRKIPTRMPVAVIAGVSLHNQPRQDLTRKF
jgi:hypothetical protein